MKKTAAAVLVLCIVLMTAVLAPASSTPQEKDKKAIVLAVFGTTYPTAVNSLTHLKQTLEQTFPGIPVKLAFTSEIIRAKWAKRASDPQWRKEHPEIPEDFYTAKNPLATIAGLQDRGYRNIAVQSTHIFAGEEYQNLKAEIETLASIRALRERDRPFQKLILGRPALGEPGDMFPYTEDIRFAAEVLQPDVEKARQNGSALVYMGHGNEIFSTGAYVELQDAMRDANPDTPIFIGTVEGYPGPDRVLTGLKHAGVKKVTLFPLMVVAGDHASNDMAGDEEDSWKALFEKSGISVVPVLRGLGEVDAWAAIYVRHLKEAMEASGF